MKKKCKQLYMKKTDKKRGFETKTALTTPIGNIITHTSPGGTKTRERTGLLGIFNIIQALKNVVENEKEKQQKAKANRKSVEEQQAKQKAKQKANQKLWEELYHFDNELGGRYPKSPRTRKFLGNATWMMSPGGLPAPIAYFNIHDGGDGVEELHWPILKVLRKAIDKNPITSSDVSNLNRNLPGVMSKYDQTVSPYLPVNSGIWREGGRMENELKESTKKKQRTLSKPMSREKELPAYALKALNDTGALRKIRGLMRGKRFDSQKNMRTHTMHGNLYHYTKSGKTLPSKTTKVVGNSKKYERPSAGALYKKLMKLHPGDPNFLPVGKIFAVPQPPNGKRVQNKQLCLRKVKNKTQAYFAPIGTCISNM